MKLYTSLSQGRLNDSVFYYTCLNRFRIDVVFNQKSMKTILVLINFV